MIRLRQASDSPQARRRLLIVAMVLILLTLLIVLGHFGGATRTFIFVPLPYTA